MSLLLQFSFKILSHWSLIIFTWVALEGNLKIIIEVQSTADTLIAHTILQMFFLPFSILSISAFLFLSKYWSAKMRLAEWL